MNLDIITQSEMVLMIFKGINQSKNMTQLQYWLEKASDLNDFYDIPLISSDVFLETVDLQKRNLLPNE